MMVVEKLDRYGYTREAKRVAEKYIKVTDKVFEETGEIWEKYNVIEVVIMSRKSPTAVCLL